MKLKALSVTHVNSYMKKIILNDPILYNLRVKGEVSNLKIHTSGNAYFSLKDESSKIRCVMFSENAIEHGEKLKDGVKIVANGYISLYERDGMLQLYVRDVEIEGEGKLYSEFLKLKEKLEGEGLFDQSRKKEIPSTPSTIGVVTSQTGAAFRDIVNVIKRRFPKVSIKLFPATVQGSSSARELASGIQIFNEMEDIDVIIIGRGGGSIEELWSFNDEELARAIAGSKVPVISAVGHETDYTISDFVSDMRAPTPSAGAEICVPSLLDIEYRLEHIKNEITKLSKENLYSKKSDMERIREKNILKRPSIIYDSKRINIDNSIENIRFQLKQILESCKSEMRMSGRNLASLNPLFVLSRGYSVVQKEGRTLKSVNEASEGDCIKVVISDGYIACTIDKIDKGNDIDVKTDI